MENVESGILEDQLVAIAAEFDSSLDRLSREWSNLCEERLSRMSISFAAGDEMGLKSQSYYKFVESLVEE